LTQANREVSEQLMDRPSIRFFIDRPPDATGPFYVVNNCPPACFFLTNQGLCGVQAAKGYAAKPETCKLFPFNNFRWAGGYLIVRPHLSLCPLQITQRFNQASGHKELFANMAAAGITAHVSEANVIVPDITRVIALERKIVRLCQEFMESSESYLSFARAQLAATQEMFGFAADIDDEFEHFVKIVRNILGVKTEELRNWENKALTQTLAACTPLLRSEMIFLSDSSDAAAKRLSLALVPYVLISLQIIAALAIEVGMESITYQALVRLFSDFLPLLKMLAHSIRRVSWQTGRVVPFPLPGDDRFQVPYMKIARALSQSRLQKATLGQIVSENVCFDGPDRIIFLRRLAESLDGRIVETDLGRTHVPVSVQSTVQQWALRNLGERVLVAMATHASERIRRRVAHGQV
jgi:hypothetical protein